jgi:kynurenine formamidase
VITRRTLQDAARPFLDDIRTPAHALVVGTPGLDVDRTTHQWSGTNPPYFTSDAIAWAVDREFAHLLCDLPSIDRESDGGSLPNHRNWWELPGELPVDLQTQDASVRRTLTEMLHVPSDLADGRYLLNLQVPALQTDAVPSRPLVAPLEPVTDD